MSAPPRLLVQLALCSACAAFTADLGLDVDLRALFRSRSAAQRQRQREELPFRVLTSLDLMYMPARHQDVSQQWQTNWKAADLGKRIGAATQRSALPPRIRANLARLLRGEEEVFRTKKSFGEDDDDVDDELHDEDAFIEPAVTPSELGVQPFWYHPCGRSVDLVVRRSDGVSQTRVTRHLTKALERVWQQLNMSVLHYKLQSFDKLYYKVRIGVEEHQYVPSWVPGKEDLLDLHSKDVQSNEQLAQHLTRMHTQLQKFSVAVEHIAQDERDDPIRHSALFKTQNYVKMLLCEVEWALLSLAIPLPEQIPRDIMSPAERYLNDNTNREVRDWGVLLRYRDFLNGWADIVSKAGRHS